MTKRVALADLGIGEDEAARLLDDAIDGRQPEAGALAHFLGGEEGLENLAEHAGARCRTRCRSPTRRCSRRPAGCRSRAPRPGRPAPHRSGWSASRRPCGAMASRALTARLTMTCSSWPGSARTGPRSRPCLTTSSTVSPSRRLSRCETSDTTSGSCSTCGRKRLLARESQQLAGQARRRGWSST